MNLTEFYELLESHDWTYQYSDDFSAWEKGEAESKRLEELSKTDPDFRKYLNRFVAHIWKGAPKPARPTAET